MNIAEFLRNVEAFQKLSSDAAERLAAEAVEQSYVAGTAILRRGEPGNCMYVIIDGQVQIPVFDGEGRQLFVAQLKEHDIFGEMALLTGEPRTADVYAVTDCRCLIFLRESVEQLIRQYADVAQLLTTLVGERLVRSGAIRQVGKYQLLGEIGKGNMSIVFEGLHPTLQRPVAIKMLSHRRVHNKLLAEQFQNEAKIVSRLRHPNIVEVYDTERAYRTFFIIMERLLGRPLDKIIEAQGPMPFDRVREILLQVAGALWAAHRQGVVHRDIKPSNIMIEPDGEVKLMDFGMALDASNRLEGEEAVAGTPRYMSPEQISGSKLDARTDIYSMGLVAYIMLTGEVSFKGRLVQVLHHHRHTPVPSPRAIRPDVPDDLESFVHRAAAKAPIDRFQNCAEILEHLGGSAEEGKASPNEMGVRTLTFVFEPDRLQEAEQLITEVKRLARAQNLVVR